MSKKLAILSLSTAGFLAPSGSALAQDITAEEIIAALLSLEDMLLMRPTPLPGSFGVASAFGLSGGQLGVSVAATNRRDGLDTDWDGSAGVAFGLGNPTTGVGFQMTASLNSVTPSEFADSGTLGFMLHKRGPGLTANGVSSFSAGVNRLAGWGDSDGIKEQYYVSASTVAFWGATPLIMTVGYGSGAKSGSGANSRATIFDPDGAAYGSVGVRVTPKVALSTGWDGDEFVAGLEVLPWQNIPLQFSFGVLDLTEEFGKKRLLFNISWLARVGN